MSPVSLRGRSLQAAVLATAVAACLSTTPAAAVPAPVTASPSGAAAVISTAHESTSARVAPRTPDLWLQVHAGPKSRLSDARVVVRNHRGKVVGRGTTNSYGVAQLVVSGEATPERPYRVRTSGGTVRGEEFDGHLELYVTRLGLRGGARYVDLVTTIAARHIDRHGGSPKSIERKAFKRLGVDPDSGHHLLKHPSHAVHAPALARHHASHDGFNGTVNHLVGRLHEGKDFPDFSTRKIERYSTVNGRLPRSGSSDSSDDSIQCRAQTLPNPEANSPTTVGVYSAMMTAGLVSAFVTKDPSLLLNGIAGMAFANTPGMTNGSMLASLQSQLSCISAQISAVQHTLDQQSLQIAVADAVECKDKIEDTWENWYEPVISAAADNPDDPYEGLFLTNGTWTGAMDRIDDMDSSCGDAINNALFTTTGGQQSAWALLVSNFKKGTYGSNDDVAFSQPTVASLQQFLQYWGSREYQQSVMMNDYFNFQKTMMNNDMSVAQKNSWGGNCMKAPSIADVTSYQSSTKWCQWQQNILNVWPGNTFSDEMADWGINPTTASPYDVSGSAVSVVPGGWANASHSTTAAIDGLNPKVLLGNDMPSSTWSVTNALTTLAGTPVSTSLQPAYQRWDYKQAEKTFAPTNKQVDDHFDLRDFYIGQLNSTISNGVVVPCTNDCRQWQILGSDSTMTIKGDPCKGDWDRRVSDAVYSPKHWTSAKSNAYLYGDTRVTACSTEPPMAWLVARPWTQGAAWPTAPAITSTGTVPSNRQLTATGCPTGGCLWSIVGTVPAGLSLSTAGLLSYSGTPTTPTVSVTVVAANTYVFSPQVTLTVTVP